MLYVLLFIAFLGGLLILKLAAGILRVILIMVLLIILGIVAMTGDEDVAPPAQTVSAP